MFKMCHIYDKMLILDIIIDIQPKETTRLETWKNNVLHFCNKFCKVPIQLCSEHVNQWSTKVFMSQYPNEVCNILEEMKWTQAESNSTTFSLFQRRRLNYMAAVNQAKEVRIQI